MICLSAAGRKTVNLFLVLALVVFSTVLVAQNTPRHNDKAAPAGSGQVIDISAKTDATEMGKEQYLVVEKYTRTYDNDGHEQLGIRNYQVYSLGGKLIKEYPDNVVPEYVQIDEKSIYPHLSFFGSGVYDPENKDRKIVAKQNEKNYGLTWDAFISNDGKETKLFSQNSLPEYERFDPQFIAWVDDVMYFRPSGLVLDLPSIYFIDLVTGKIDHYDTKLFIDPNQSIILSPDKKYLVFSAIVDSANYDFEGGGSGHSNSVYTLDLQSGKTLRMTHPIDYETQRITFVGWMLDDPNDVSTKPFTEASAKAGAFLLPIDDKTYSLQPPFLFPWPNAITRMVTRTGDDNDAAPYYVGTCENLNNETDNHGYYAVDFDVPDGVYDEVLAVADGEVVRSNDICPQPNQGNGYGYGKTVVIRHTDVPDQNGNHQYTMYAHLNNVYVNVGDHVCQGMIIGNGGNMQSPGVLGGNPGNLTCNQPLNADGQAIGGTDHLHFEYGVYPANDPWSYNHLNERRYYGIFSEVGCAVVPESAVSSGNIALEDCNNPPPPPPVLDCAQNDPYEHNDNFAQARLLDGYLGTHWGGDFVTTLPFCSSYTQPFTVDEDFYSFHIDYSGEVTFRITDLPWNLNLYLYDANHDFIASSLNAGQDDEEIILCVGNNGNMCNFYSTLYLRVTSPYLPFVGNVTGSYNLQIDWNQGNNVCVPAGVQDLLPPTITITPANPVICNGNSVQLVASGGGGMYTWSPATGLSCTTCANPVASPTATTTYTVTSVVGTGCYAQTVSASCTVTVRSLPNANAGNNQTITLGQSAQLSGTGGGTYSWSPTGTLNNPNIANPVATPTSTTTYRLTVTNQYGCTASSSMTVTVTQPNGPANDNPCGAVQLTAGNSCSWTSSTNVGATATLNVPAPYSCTGTNVNTGGYNGGDVWFRVTVPASGAIIIDTRSNVHTDLAMAVYSANSCNATFSQIACSDDRVPGQNYMPYLLLTGLTPGLVKYIRVWDFNNNNFGSFDICVVHARPNLTDNATTFSRTGRSFTLNNRVRNSGNLAAGTFYTRFYLSTNNVLNIGVDPMIREFVCNSLAVGNAAAGTTTITVSPQVAPAGTYYLFLKHDATDLITESNENDNIFYFNSPFTLAANFAGDNAAADDGDAMLVTMVIIDDDPVIEFVSDDTNTLPHYPETKQTCNVTTNGRNVTVSNIDPLSTYTLCNSLGQIICTGTAHEGIIQCQPNNPGIYFLSIVDGVGARCVQKVVVSE